MSRESTYGFAHQSTFVSPNQEFLGIGGSSFSGTIPSSFGMHPNLANLAVFGSSEIVPGEAPNLSGNIPTELGLLKSITEITIGGTEVSSEIPTEFGMLGALTSLNLRQNDLSGSVPSELGQIEGLSEYDL